MSKKVAVIGAGPAGLIAAQILGHKNFFPNEDYSVTLFEAHSKPGGCASYFRRKLNENDFAVFDAGATVLNAVHKNAFMFRLFNKLGHSHLNFDSTFNTYFSFEEEHRIRNLSFSNISEFVKSLSENFPKDAHWISRDFPSLFEDVLLLRNYLERCPVWPVQNIQDVLHNIIKMNLSDFKLCKLLPIANTQFEEWLESKHASPDLRKFFNMLLFITLQCRSQEALVPWGLFAVFFYPMGIGVCRGGMKEYFDAQLSLVKKQSAVRMKEKVESLELKAGRWELKTTMGAMESFDFIFSAIPRFNTERLLGESISPQHLQYSQTRPKLWSAMVGYFVVEDSNELPKEAFNLHLKGSNGSEAYYSFSGKENLLRAPTGLRTVTASTHWSLDDKFPEQDYERSKNQKGEEFLLEPLSRRFSKLGIVFKEFATPETFEHYTSRIEGNVGGIPLSQSYTWWNAPSFRTPYPTLYQIGDTSFPGQSIYACSIGALSAIEDAFKLRLPI